MPDSNEVFRVVSSTILLRELRREVPENLRKSEKNLFSFALVICFTYWIATVRGAGLLASIPIRAGNQ